MRDRMKMFVEDWVREQRLLEEALDAAKKAVDEHQSLCAHRYSNGVSVLYPTGYGDSRCRACGTQTD